MVDAAGARPPAALEVDAPAVRHDLPYAPALRRHDMREQIHRVATVAFRHEAVDAEEEARLVGGVDAGVPPDRRCGSEAAHPGAAGECTQARGADLDEDRGSRGIVGA